MRISASFKKDYLIELDKNDYFYSGDFVDQVDDNQSLLIYQSIPSYAIQNADFMGVKHPKTRTFSCKNALLNSLGLSIYLPTCEILKVGELGISDWHQLEYNSIYQTNFLPCLGQQTHLGAIVGMVGDWDFKVNIFKGWLSFASD